MITWPDFTLPPINQPVLMPALEFYEMINKGDKMTIEQKLDELRKKNEVLEARIECQQKQLDVAMACIFVLQEKINVFGTIADK